MFRRFTKKRVIAAVTAIAALALAAGAFAYFTSTGSTTGTGSVGNATQWTVADSSTPSTLYPGQGSFAIAGSVTNASSGNQGLNSLTVTINAPTNTGTISSEAACTAADFALSSASGSGWTVATGGDSATYTWSPADDLASSGTQAYPSGLSISMNDLTHAQDNCQGATVNWGDSVN
jgi:hypothetical protein